MPENIKKTIYVQTPDAHAYKYALKERLENMTKKESEEFFGMYTDRVGDTVRNFYHWANIPLTSDTVIPAKKLEILAAIFNCQPDDLKNYKVIAK